MSCPSLVCVERPCPRRSCATTRYPLERKNSSWLSQSSADNGQPWLKTIGCPSPQSLKKISVPSLVVIVPMVRTPSARKPLCTKDVPQPASGHDTRDDRSVPPNPDADIFFG